MDHYIHDSHFHPKKQNQPQILIVDDEIFNIQAMKIVFEYVIKISNLKTLCNHVMNG